jgi:amino acid transporter
MRFWLRLFFSNGAFHRRAFEEVFIITAVSVVPLLLLPFIAGAKSAAEVSFDFSTTIWSAVSSGQLYLYSLSVFGNIIWLCVEDWKQEFPPRKYFVLSSMLAAFLCVLIYSVDPTLSKPLNPVLVKISIWIYGIYLLMYYTLLVFKMLRAPSINDTVENEVGVLIGQSRKRRRPTA